MRISDWSSDVCSSDLAFIIRVIATSTTPAAAALTWNCGSGREIQLNIWIGITVNGDDSQRSEEHTSELQSLMRISYAVFCLKKKTNLKHKIKNHNINK